MGQAKGRAYRRGWHTDSGYFHYSKCQVKSGTCRNRPNMNSHFSRDPILCDVEVPHSLFYLALSRWVVCWPHRWGLESDLELNVFNSRVSLCSSWLLSYFSLWRELWVTVYLEFSCKVLLLSRLLVHHSLPYSKLNMSSCRWIRALVMSPHFSLSGQGAHFHLVCSLILQLSPFQDSDDIFAVFIRPSCLLFWCSFLAKATVCSVKFSREYCALLSGLASSESPQKNLSPHCDLGLYQGLSVPGPDKNSLLSTSFRATGSRGCQ